MKMHPVVKRSLSARVANGASLTRSAFTFAELLVSVAIIASLASLLSTSISRARALAGRTTCQNHLREIALSVRMYADDMNDLGPSTMAPPKMLDSWTAYRRLVSSYLARSTNSSLVDNLFACPADKYHYSFTAASMKSYAYIPEPVYRQPWSEHSSYCFNGGNARSNTLTGATSPGIVGVKLSSIREPSKTILLAEYPAFFPFSWHRPQNRTSPHYFNNAQNMIAFVDGHVSYVKIFYDPHRVEAESWQYDPPASYAYKWSAE
jgi:prepilin-type processing-associated H-X9-DG protein